MYMTRAQAWNKDGQDQTTRRERSVGWGGEATGRGGTILGHSIQQLQSQ